LLRDVRKSTTYVVQYIRLYNYYEQDKILN